MSIICRGCFLEMSGICLRDVWGGLGDMFRGHVWEALGWILKGLQIVLEKAFRCYKTYDKSMKD